MTETVTPTEKSINCNLKLILSVPQFSDCGKK